MLLLFISMVLICDGFTGLIKTDMQHLAISSLLQDIYEKEILKILYRRSENGRTKVRQ